jgi:secreted trypsin-like serine protease
MGAISQPIIGGSADASSTGLDNVATAVAAIVVENAAAQPSLCSGILVAQRFILTAAHCAQGSAPTALHVSFGPSAAPFASVDKCASPITYPVIALTRNPDADIMVVELGSEVAPSIPVVPIAQTSPTVGQMGVIAGYGVTDQDTVGERGYVGTTVVGVGSTVPGYTPPDCEAGSGVCSGDGGASSAPLLITVNSGAAAGACAGDSGGPLLVRDPSLGWQVAGVLSEGSESCTGEDVYVDLASVGEWIDAHVRS